MAVLLPEPVPSEGCGHSASVPAASAGVALARLLLLVVILTALIVLLARGVPLADAISIIGVGGLFASELRNRLL
ncbi:hypothetical protein [Streptomyces malaysiensis]|uniref:Uncharacterized protein n=1 Tax=Streptomyces malaysiensis subsp. samsunensis TaxID=459658 RepID=A0A9X2M7N6_STRMQ|nr:hypothetical protein [Streptomyces samsunensis]MCQ8836573.1 hypothetical protein [Streptomyces samsunensis]